MEFTDLELSKKLVEVGCWSDSMYRWCLFQDNLEDKIWEPHLIWLQADGAPFIAYEGKRFMQLTSIPAFTLSDFVGTHEQARENARLVWGNKNMAPAAYQGQMLDDTWRAFNVARHAMIDAPDWREYVRASLGEDPEGL